MLNHPNHEINDVVRYMCGENRKLGWVESFDIFLDGDE
jgi:hypothetical protein